MPAPPTPSFTRRIPEGDSRERRVCDHCGFIDYVNPRIVVGAVCTWEDRILLCRRSIEPRRGYWTLPAGFLETEETVEEGVLREVREEVRGAEIELDGLLALYSVRRISQVQLFYRARLRSPEVAAGAETLEVQLARWGDIPWGELAFPTVGWALRHFHQVRDLEAFPPFANPSGESGEY
jgi:ADP-ribose pyrophosphatase YjhB (NUDIX family)